MTADLLFWFQIILAWVFCLAQAKRMLSSTQGTTITWFLFFECFLALNLYLARGAYRDLKDRKSWQILMVYVNWTVFITVNLAIILWNGSWTRHDTIVSFLVLGSAALFLLMKFHGSLAATIADPINMGVLALFFKAIPQLFLGYCVWQANSAAGLAGLSLAVGHINICTRIIEIWLAAKGSSWNRKLVGSLISEIGNEGSWLVVTIVWFFF